MAYVILLNLQLIYFFVCPVIENFKKILIRYFAIGSIVVYHTTIILKRLNKVANYMKLKLVKVWSI